MKPDSNENTAIFDTTEPFSLLHAGELTCGIDFLTDFWEEKYLREFIRDGGSKIKFVTGRPGSGKTHLLRLACALAEKENYKTVRFSARNIWMHDFKEIYVEIFRQCGIASCLEGISRHLIEEMGFQYTDIPEGMKFIDYLSQNGSGDAITKREIRSQLRQIFLNNSLLDNNFALACSMLTGSILGYPILEEQNRDLLLSWMEGDRSVKLSQLRALDFYPSRITKYNARHMLRSLAEVVRMGGYSGLFIAIDDLEILTSRSSLEPVHYTKMKREDTYESIRQLIDDIDSMKNIFFVYAFDRELVDNENAGLKSYQALWMRIQNEVVGERFNRFSDMVDLDRLAMQEYTPEVIKAISESLAVSGNAVRPDSFTGSDSPVGSDIPSGSIDPPRNAYSLSAIDDETARRIAAQARTGALGIPQLILNAMQEVNANV